MASINNTNSYGRSGTLGLASGIDSESVIDNMMAAMQNKIDKQKAIRQQILWKQNIYRDVTSELLTMQRNFLNSLNPSTNLRSSSLYVNQTVHVSGTSLKASSLVPNNPPLTIESISQLATGKVVRSGERLSKDIQVNVDITKLNETLKVDFNLDGITKSIALRGASEAEVLSNLEIDLNQTFGSGIVVTSDGKITTLNQRELKINGTRDALAMLGLSQSVSNTLDLSKKLSDLNLSQALIGNTFTFTINNIDFSFDGSATMSEVIARVNQSEAGVQLRYSNLEDSFHLTSKTLGSGVALNFEDKAGNLLGSLFGRDNLSSVENTSLNLNRLTSVGSSLDGFTGGNFKLTINGKEETITLAEGSYDQTSALSALNQQLSDKFGVDSIKISHDGFQYIFETDRAVSFTSTEGLNALMGFTTQSTAIQMDHKLSDAGLSGTININGMSIDLSALNTFQDLSDQLSLQGLTLSIDAGKLTFSSNVSLVINGDTNTMNALFGNETITFKANTNTSLVEDGKNARFSIGGTVYERNTNNFNLNGYAIQLTSTSTEAINIHSENNVDAVVDSLQKFVGAYNAIIDKVNALVQAKAEYRDFPPLTDTQKEAMSEKEVEQWEIKAKEGLVRNDTVLSSLLSELRTALSTPVTGSKLSLLDLGITSSNYADRGKLTIDETKLKSVLNTRADEVQHLMTSEDGLIERFNTRLDGYVRSTFTNPGRLVSLAGLANTVSATKNNLNDRITSIDATVKRLQALYETQRERYWKQFTSLEKVISQMNSQSSWLSQQLGQ
jgi:flagellar capping protein FliD